MINIWKKNEKCSLQNLRESSPKKRFCDTQEAGTTWTPEELDKRQEAEPQKSAKKWGYHMYYFF